MTTAEFKEIFKVNGKVLYEGKEYYASGMMVHRNVRKQIINSVCITNGWDNSAYWVSVDDVSRVV